MPAHRYKEENGLAAKVATKRLADVTQEVNLRECVTCTSLISANKAVHSAFETQMRRGISRPTKRTDVLRKFVKKSKNSSLPGI